ncbi:MAG: hypothetical protein M3081_10035 [Gemmatimonadota bacterium]|nr:hypothetical protein [Gemmatimonadota bacterium]
MHEREIVTSETSMMASAFALDFGVCSGYIRYPVATEFRMPKSDFSFDPSAYALVAERIALFYTRYPAGRIITDLIARTERETTFRASVFRTAEDTSAAATGWASEREGDGDINTVACLENTETSAIGRALANLGFTASRQRPSREEMDKVGRTRARITTRGVNGAVALSNESSSARDHYASMLADVLALVDVAARRDVRPRRAAALRRQLMEARLPATKLLEIERRLRRRLGHRPAPVSVP